MTKKKTDHGDLAGLPKRAEEKLRRSEERFRSIFDNMAEGMALHELIVDKTGKPIIDICINNAIFTEGMKGVRNAGCSHEY